MHLQRKPKIYNNQENKLQRTMKGDVGKKYVIRITFGCENEV